MMMMILVLIGTVLTNRPAYNKKSVFGILNNEHFHNFYFLRNYMSSSHLFFLSLQTT
jgi:hypothetical protein